MSKLFHKNIFVLFSIIVIILSFMFYLYYDNMNKYSINIKWMNHSQEVLINIRRLENHFKDFESSFRGYVITRNDIFLNRLDSFNKLLNQDMINIRELLIDNTVQLENLKVVEEFVNLKINFTNNLLKLLDTNPDIAIQKIKNLENQNLTTSAEEKILVLRSEENRIFSERTTQYINSELNSRIILMVVAAFIFTIVVIVYIITALNINHKLTTEKRLIESEEKYRAVAETAVDAIITTDVIGNIVLWNRSSENIFGYKSDEIVGQNIKLIMSLEKYNDYQKKLQLYALGKYDFPKESLYFKLKRKDGTEFQTETKISTWKQNDKWFITRIIRDITERERIKEELATKKLELEKSNESLKQFAYIASHDLQEPLRMIHSYCKLLEKRYKGKLDADADEFIYYVTDGAERMKALIQSLLTYSRVDRNLKFVFSDCNVLLKTALKNLEVVIKESDAKIVVENTLPALLVEPILLTQLFQNLIGNALKFRSGKLPEIKISCIHKDKIWEFCVADNGIGIPEEFHKKLFILFQRLNHKTEYPGTGMGLAICKKIVELHKGDIWIKSEEGKGTKFFFTLPSNLEK